MRQVGPPSPQVQADIDRRREAIRKWFDQSDLVEGAPSHAPEIVEQICERIVEHGETLTKICKEKTVPDAPSLTTLLFWRRCDPRVASALNAARAARAETLFEKAEDDIDKIFDDAMEVGTKDHLMAASQRAKLLWERRKYEVSKMLPAIYGEAADRRLALDVRKEGAANYEEAVERMAKDGKIIVQQQIIEIPALEAPALPEKVDDRDDS